MRKKRKKNIKTTKDYIKTTIKFTVQKLTISDSNHMMYLFSVAEPSTCDVAYGGLLPPPVCPGNHIISVNKHEKTYFKMHYCPGSEPSPRYRSLLQIYTVFQNRRHFYIYKCKKTTFIKTVIGDVVAHLKPQKFTVLSYL